DHHDRGHGRRRGGISVAVRGFVIELGDEGIVGVDRPHPGSRVGIPVDRGRPAVVVHPQRPVRNEQLTGCRGEHQPPGIGETVAYQRGQALPRGGHSCWFWSSCWSWSPLSSSLCLPPLASRTSLVLLRSSAPCPFLMILFSCLPMSIDPFWRVVMC